MNHLKRDQICRHSLCHDVFCGLVDCDIVTLGQTHSAISIWPIVHRTFLRTKEIDWCVSLPMHDDIIKWKHFPRYWPFGRGILRSLMNSPHQGQWGGALMFSLICAWIDGRVNKREAGDLRRHRAHYDVIVIVKLIFTWLSWGQIHSVIDHWRSGCTNYEPQRCSPLIEHRPEYKARYAFFTCS